MHGNQWVLKIAVLKYYSVSKRGTTAKSNPKQATAYRRIMGLTTVKTEGSTQATALAVTLFIKAVELIHPIIYKVRFTALDFILAE